jgi:arginine decarboxylase
MLATPSNFAFWTGIGISVNELTAFDNALVVSGLADYSLVRISSILPPKCKLQENIFLPIGSPVLAAYTHLEANSESVISAAVGVAVPQNETDHGMIMEISGLFSKDTAEEKVHEMLLESMRSRNILIKDTIIKSADANVMDNSKYVSAFAAVLLW